MPNRLLMGWDKPLLPEASRYLRETYGRADRWDLTSAVLVVPTRRARRRLIELLHLEAEEHDLVLHLPKVLTVGDLPERLYRPPRPIAFELEQTLAWARVLTDAEGAELAPLLPTLPPRDPVAPWMELAGTLRRLHETLSADGLMFSDVTPSVETESERNRWQLLDRLLARYVDQLKLAGRADPHLSRREAIRAGSCRSERQIVLIGTSDLSKTLTEMLGEVADSVTSLIAAPPEATDLFDAFGSVVAARWSHRELPLKDHHLVSAGDAAEQAEAVAAQLAEFGEVFSPDAIAVGVTDGSLVPLVETELDQCGVAVHREEGWPLSETAPGRLLSLTAGMLTRRNWQALAAFVRHADVYRWLDVELGRDENPAAKHWLIQFDELVANHYPTLLETPLPQEAIERYPAAIEARDRVATLLSSLERPRQRLGDWCQTIRALVAVIYPESQAESAEETSAAAGKEVTDAAQSDGSAAGGSTTDPVRLRTARASRAIDAILGRLESVSESLDLQLPAAAAMETLVGRLVDTRVVMSASPEMVEILGWLDLALEDASAMVVVGLNHPFVPESVTADPFLPGSLRTRLMMADNDRRFARDAYALQLILSTRPAIRLIVGRRGVDGSPTPPSRLLAACQPEDAARRILRLLDEPAEVPPVVHRWSGASEATDLPVPTAAAYSPVKTLSVTAFRDYLQCPYRFYLRHVLRLRPLDDASRELAANQFGDLVHGAVEDFALSPDRDADEAKEIFSLLIEHLHAFALRHYGPEPAAAVRLQIAQAQRRLRIVADRQAERRQQGWKIWAAEASVDEKGGAGIHVDGKWMGLRGRFDRIDHNEKTGQWAILDYKTHGHPPLKKHLEKSTGRWLDLQLPLYRIMAPFLGIDAPPEEVQLGYFNIADKDADTRINLADFTEEQFSEATELIHDCIRGIWAGRFEMTSDPVPFDDYGMICQTGVAQNLLDAFDLELSEETE